MGDFGGRHGGWGGDEDVSALVAYFSRVCLLFSLLPSFCIPPLPFFCSSGWCIELTVRGRFDEVHFGGFAAKYIKQKFFMDVHPPLAKLLITLAAFVGGFDGEFDFKDIGK
jgi:dolichyl-phosphate-mannose--protein O-mannosyl transferase